MFYYNVLLHSIKCTIDTNNYTTLRSKKYSRGDSIKADVHKTGQKYKKLTFIAIYLLLGCFFLQQIIINTYSIYIYYFNI